MLITAKRCPVTGGHGPALNTLVFTGTTSYSRRESFFNRGYASYARQNRPATNKIVSSLKYISTNEDSQPPVRLLKNYKQLKDRNTIKVKMRHISENETELAGAIDIRLSRQKSPRNAEFIARIVNNSAQENANSFVSYKKTAKKNNRKTLAIGKSNRRVKIKMNSNRTLLHKVRSQAITRRIATFVKNQKYVAESLLLPTQQKRFGIDAEKNTALRQTTPVLSPVLNTSFNSTRNVLHSRNATKRKPVLTKTPALVVPARSFQIRKQLRVSARKSGLNERMIAHVGIKKKFSLFNIKKTKLFKNINQRTKVSCAAVHVEKKKTSVSAKLTEYDTRIVPLFRRKFHFITKATKLKNIQKFFIKRLKPARIIKKNISELAAKETARKGVSL